MYTSRVRIRRAFRIARRTMDNGRFLRCCSRGWREQQNDVVLDGSDVLGAAADYHNETGVRRFYVPEIVRPIAQIYVDSMVRDLSGPRAGCSENWRTPN
jgi:hypothetical protein